MKTNFQTQKMKLFLLSILFVMLLQSCTKDNKCSDSKDVIINYNIADSNEAKIPYTGTDTLVFISDKGDTATLIGQGKKTIYTQIIKSVNDDCTKSTIYNYENLKCIFIGENKFLTNFQYCSYMDNKVQSPSLTTITLYSNGNIIANSSYEFLYSREIPDDSVLLSNIFYKGNYINYNKTALFNSQLGIIKFIDLYNKLWKLNSKK